MFSSRVPSPYVCRRGQRAVSGEARATYPGDHPATPAGRCVYVWSHIWGHARQASTTHRPRRLQSNQSRLGTVSPRPVRASQPPSDAALRRPGGPARATALAPVPRRLVLTANGDETVEWRDPRSPFPPPYPPPTPFSEPLPRRVRGRHVSDPVVVGSTGWQRPGNFVLCLPSTRPGAPVDTPTPSGSVTAFFSPTPGPWQGSRGAPASPMRKLDRAHAAYDLPAQARIGSVRLGSRRLRLRGRRMQNGRRRGVREGPSRGSPLPIVICSTRTRLGRRDSRAAPRANETGARRWTGEYKACRGRRHGAEPG